MPATFLALGVIALVAAPACGGKSKGNQTSPDQPDSKDPSDLKGTGPDTSGDIKTTGGGKGDPDATPEPPGTGDKPGAGKDPVAGTDGDGPGATPEAPRRKFEPPKLDISDAEKASRTREHIRRARNALTGINKDPNLAIKEARDALAVDSKSVTAVVLLAHAYYFRGLDETARALLDSVYESDDKTLKARARKNAKLYYVYGLIYDRTGEKARAMLAYETGRKLNNRDRNIALNLGVHYLKDSRYDEALAIFQKLIDGGLKSATVWTNLGSAHRGRSAASSASKSQRTKSIRAAETAYKRAIDANKNYSNAYYNLGLLYFDADPFPLGKGTMDKLKRLDRAKTYFSEYRSLPGADIKRVDENIRRVDKMIRKETKRRKKAKKKKAKKKDDDW